MSQLYSLYGFRVWKQHRFRIHGARFRLGPRGVRALKILAEIAAHAPNAASGSHLSAASAALPPPSRVHWLLPLRPLIREIQQLLGRR